MKKVYKDGKYTGIELHDENDDKFDGEDFGYKILGFITLPLGLFTIYYIIKLWYCVLICVALWGLVCLLLYNYYRRKKISDESVWKMREVFVLHGLFTAMPFCGIVGYCGYEKMFPLTYNMFGKSAGTVNTIALFIIILVLTLIFSGISASIFEKSKL